ncbi:MAG TPA: hypothetical protein PLJ18_12260 [Niabella sp.]|nr:hypothetical protein [Niabella sp.]
MSNSKEMLAKFVNSGQQKTWHDRIMVYFYLNNHGTKEDIAKYLRCEQEPVHKRLSELADKKLIKATNLSKRAKSTGSNQTVWARSSLKEITIKI